MAGVQTKVTMQPAAPLSSALVSNAATLMESAEKTSGSPIDGMVTYPLEVHAQRLTVAEQMLVDGDNIILGDGVVYARNLVQTALLIANSAQIGDTIIGPNHLSVNELSAISANTGTLTAGAIIVATGGVTISNDGGASGVHIGGNEIYAKYDGVKTVLIDGPTGQITAIKFLLKTADSGERLEAGGNGVLVYDGDEVLRTKLTAAEGITIISGDPANMTQSQQLTFKADGCSAEGSIFLRRSTYTLTRTVEG